MYHIKNDKRQIDSAMSLMKGLTECLSKKRMSDISVSDLCSASGVSRSTFYRIFDTPLDLLEYTSDYYVSKAISDYPEDVLKSNDDFVLYSLMYWKNHTDLLEAVLNCDRIDIIRKSFESHSEKIILKIESKFDEIEQIYVQAVVAGLITSLLTVWFKRGCKETPSQLFELYKKLSVISIE